MVFDSHKRVLPNPLIDFVQIDICWSPTVPLSNKNIVNENDKQTTSRETIEGV